jgi:hypothetical protein
MTGKGNRIGNLAKMISRRKVFRVGADKTNTQLQGTDIPENPLPHVAPDTRD